MDLDPPWGGGHWTLAAGVQHLVDCILDPDKPVFTSGEHARHVIEIINNGYESACQRRSPSLETSF